MHPEKQDIWFPHEPDEDQTNPDWRISQSPSGEMFIKNISASYLQVNDIILETNQEKELFGGERLSFDQDKTQTDQNFDYVFFLMKPQSDLKRERETRTSESEKLKKLVKIEKELPKELTCPICTNFLHKCLVLVPCQHTFCSFCLFDHLKLSSQCPLCRVEAVSIAKNLVLSNMIQLVEDNFPALNKAQDRKELEEINFSGDILRNEQGVYIGSCVNGKRDGQGKFIEKNGRIYEGSWRNDGREGKGVMIWENGVKYDGDWVNNLFHGMGKYLWKNGEVYEGNFQEHYFSGYGTRKYKSGGIYQGDWKKDRRNGNGIFTFHNGDKYEGKWLNGVLEPKAKVEYSNGEKYEGEIDANSFKKKGKGTLLLSNGDKYEGSWVNDVLESEVKIEYSNGDRYEGEIDAKSLKKQGNGILTLNSGDKYSGNWIEDVLQCQVKIEYLNGDKYEGEVNVGNLQRQGKGVLISSNGDKYDGDWVNDKQHGNGREVSQGGKRMYEGVWEEGKINGDGVITYADGTRFKMKVEKLEEEGETQQGDSLKENKETNES